MLILITEPNFTQSLKKKLDLKQVGDAWCFLWLGNTESFAYHWLSQNTRLFQRFRKGIDTKIERCYIWKRAIWERFCSVKRQISQSKSLAPLENRSNAFLLQAWTKPETVGFGLRAFCFSALDVTFGERQTQKTVRPDPSGQSPEKCSKPDEQKSWSGIHLQLSCNRKSDRQPKIIFYQFLGLIWKLGQTAIAAVGCFLLGKCESSVYHFTIKDFSTKILNKKPRVCSCKLLWFC